MQRFPMLEDWFINSLYMKNSILLFLVFFSFHFIQAQIQNGFTCQEAACLSDNLGVTLNNEASPPTPPLSFTCGVTHNNLFYRFCAESEEVLLTIETSNCSMGLGVQAIFYETSDCANFTEIACLSKGSVEPFDTILTTTPGHNYLLMIDGFSNDVCDFTVTASNIESDFSRPPTPEFDNGGDSLKLELRESTELNVTNAQGCNQVYWFSPDNRNIITFEGRSRSALIRGNTEGSATLCAAMTNFCTEKDTSCIVVQVSDTDQTGQGEVCSQAVCLSNNLGRRINNANVPASEPLEFSCGTTHNNLFFAFCPSQEDVQFNISPANCTRGLGIQAVIYQTDDCRNFEEKMCVTRAQMSTLRLDFTGIPGENYILMIDGNAGDVCDFIVQGSGLSNIGDPPDLPQLNLNENLKLNVGRAIGLSVSNNEDCVSYFVQSAAEDSLIQIDYGRDSIYITGLAEGQTEVCVTASNFCFQSTTCLGVNIGPCPKSLPTDQYEIRSTLVGSNYFVELILANPENISAITWVDGYNGSERLNVNPGFHTVYLNDRFGCEIPIVFNVGNVLDDTGWDVSPTSIHPNPVRPGASVSIRGLESWQKIQLYSTSGSLELERSGNPVRQFNIPGQLGSGVYYLILSNAQLTESFILLVL